MSFIHTTEAAWYDHTADAGYTAMTITRMEDRARNIKRLVVDVTRNGKPISDAERKLAADLGADFVAELVELRAADRDQFAAAVLDLGEARHNDDAKVW